MTNSETYKRLSRLFEKLGIPYPDGSREKGELLAYCTAITAVQNDFETAFEQMLADTAYGLGLSLYCEMFKIDSSMSDAEKRKLIKQGLCRQYGGYLFGKMTGEIETLGEGFSVTADNFSLTVNGSVGENSALLSKIGEILENYLPPCVTAKSGGDGADFDYWDSTPYLFKDYDNLKLGFEFLDTLD